MAAGCNARACSAAMQWSSKWEASVAVVHGSRVGHRVCTAYTAPQGTREMEERGGGATLRDGNDSWRISRRKCDDGGYVQLEVHGSEGGNWEAGRSEKMPWG